MQGQTKFKVTAATTCFVSSSDLSIAYNSVSVNSTMQTITPNSTTRCYGLSLPARQSRKVAAAVAKPSKQPVTSDDTIPWLLSASVAAAPLLAAAPAYAKGGEFGILEGRTIALIHPAVMGFLFVWTCYAGYLGFQWRETRELPQTIKELKAQLPAAVEGVRPASPLDGEIEALEEKRKELVAGKYKDKHFNAGSILLASGVIIAIEGCLNTWSRTGKLFPGPHLFAGAGIVALWAAAAALVPAMQKGNEGARIGHIVLNTLNVLLFLWQIPTGLEIVGKVFQFTSWP